MTRPEIWYGLTAALLGWSCAGQPVASNNALTKPDEACSNVALAGVSEQTAKRLASAANVIEYENAWRDAYPGATLGTVSHAQVSSLVRSKTPEVQGCYESRLGKLRDGRGRVVVRFVIDATGKAANVSVTSNDFDDPQVGCCLAKHIAQWALPAPAGGDFVVVEYPFVVRISGSQ